MKLSFLFLTVWLIASTQGAVKQDKIEADPKKLDSKKTESSRRGRFFLLGNLLAGPAALASAGANSVGNSFLSLGKTLGVISTSTTVTTRPDVILVSRQCPLPLFTGGCPAGYVCAAVTPGGTRCVPQAPDGFQCTTGFQCTSGVCRENVCSPDQCSPDNPRACPQHQHCVATSRGHRCQPTNNRCPRPLSSDGCNRNQYCTTSATGNVCTDKLIVLSACTENVECVSGTCRGGRCREDACPQVDMSIDCMPTQYCSPGERGNMCVAKKERGALCSSPHQCVSNVCERGVCVMDECPHPYETARCLPSQFCSPAPGGNMCMEKRDTGGSCHRDAECQSSMCRNRRCVNNQCPTPFSADGCSMMSQYCMATNDGNMCTTRIVDGSACMMGVQCMSNSCVSGQCAAPTTPAPTLKPNGTPCASDSECASTFCVLGTCAASRMSIGGMCVAATDCQSMICTNMRCVDSATTTAATTTAGTTTTAATTVATTTTAATTTAATALPLGSACTVDTECASMRCLAMVCTEPLLAIGDMCTANNECLSNNCNTNMCMIGIVTMGSPCTNNFQCITGFCLASNLCA